MGTQPLHNDNGPENADDLQEGPCRENLVEQRHVMLHRLAPMTQPNSKLERLLSQRTHTTSCERRNFNDGCFGL